ncbi:tryptamine 5-hydroxylase-like [Rutidosis leptorrhynchoides]|uniref:tryptamine 5-hydroxylase-like n=1 Tax=Rutidosis leptorrhynchoides TaxID=125765 RepID=UPI003A993B7B
METFSVWCFPLLLLLTILIEFIRRRRHRSQSVTLPSPPNNLPIIGHLLHLVLFTDMPPHVTFTQLATQLGRVPILHLQLGRVNTVVISSPRLARLVFKTHDHVFSNRPQLISAQYLSFNCSDVTFSPYGPYWRQARRICVTELLSQTCVSSFRLVRDEEVNRLLTVLSMSKSGSEVDLSKLLFGLANDVLCKVAFGRRFDDGKLVGVLTETQSLFAGFCLGDFFPEWGWVNSVSGYKRRCMQNLTELRIVCDEIINEHLEKKKKTTMEEREDFVDVLLRIQRSDDLEVPISDDNLKALVLDMFVAGTDTTFAILEWTMTELIRHPDIMREAQDEVRKVANDAGKVCESHLQHLHFLKAVIKEAMRLHPPVPLLVPRESMEKCILDGYEIPAKTRVLINAYAIGRDPESWQNPLQYDPRRFLEKNNVEFKDQDFRFLPFGGGRRGCPGFAFGVATVEIALARLLYHFDWALPRGVGIEDIDLDEIFGLATRKRSALVLIPTPNKDYPL